MPHPRRPRSLEGRRQVSQQDALERPLEQVDRLVRLDERHDVLLEPLDLPRRETAESGQGDLERGQTHSRLEALDDRGQPQGLFVDAVVRRRLQAGKLQPARFRIAVQQQRVDQGAGAVALVGRRGDRRRHAVDQPRRVLDVRRRRLTDPIDGGREIGNGGPSGRGCRKTRSGRMTRLAGGAAGRGQIGKLAVPGRIDPPDPLRQRRMRREHRAEAGGRPAEEHVTGLRRVRVLHPRAGHEAADLPERAGDAARMPRELHGGGVGQELALPADGGLDQVAEERARETDDRQPGAEREDRQGALVVPGASAPGVERHPQHEVADHPDEEDAVEQADQPDVQPHVPVQDVAELVGDDALEFVAVEDRRRSPRDADDGVPRREAGGERVDAGFAVHQVDRRRRGARGDRHLFDDVEQPALDRVRGAAIHQPAAKLLGDHPAAAAQLRDPVEAAAANHDQGGNQGQEQQARVRGGRPVDLVRLRIAAEETEGRGQQELDRNHDRRHGEAEQRD